MSDKLMLIDGNSIANRAFYGLPILTNSQGLYTNAVYGFLNIFFKLIEEEHPKYVGIAFDLKAPTFRHDVFADYKGTRKGMPDELRPQMPLLKEVLASMNLKIFEVEGYEADDILGTLSLKGEKEGMEVVVVSGDRDLLQLASDTLKVRIPKTKMGRTEIEDYFAEDVIEKYGVTPTQFIDLKALMGDSSDNIPGVPGIGEKTATKIIQQFDNIENAIENYEKVTPKKASNNLDEFREQARMSKFLATIERNMPIDVDFTTLGIEHLLNTNSYEYFKKLEFKSLLEKFSKEDIRLENTKQITYKLIDTINEAKEIIENLDVKDKYSYVICEENNELRFVGLYNDKINGNIFSVNEELTSELLIKTMQSFFEDSNYKKISHGAKNDYKLLKKFGVTLSSLYLDTEIAGYVLDPVRDTYNYDDIAGEFLSITYPSEEEILGKGKSKKLITELEIQESINYIGDQCYVSYAASQLMIDKIKENNQEELLYKIEMPLLYVLADMEELGIKINKDELETYQKRLEESIDILTSEIYEMAGEEFNINSPKQLGVVLFEKLGLKGGKKTKTGYSTAADILEKLKVDNPIVEKILTYRQLVKLKSTYADGLLNVMNKETHRIYSTFNQTITATGRISSTEPNLQNIPIRLELGRELRKVFIPEEDYIFVDADYSQIELRLLAHISGDETLINAFKNGQDIHRLTASQVFGVPFDEVTSTQRSNAKAVNFGIVYGIGAFSLSQDLNITRKEADAYIKGYFEKYPNVKKYLDTTIENAEKDGYVTTIFNRRRYMPELKSNNFIMKSFGERVAMNMPIQGSAADIIKIAMVKVYNRLKEENLKSKLILQVHDELLLEVHKDEVKIVTDILKYEMEHAVDLSITLEADVHSGLTWYDAK